MTRSSDHPGPSGPAPRGQLVIVATPVGDARLWLHPAAGAIRSVLVLGHGAGRGADTADLLALAAELPKAGITVVRLDQPWVVAGRKVAGPPAQLDHAWLAAVPQALALVSPGTPLVVAGRSAGARVACRTAQELDAVGVIALAFPLHPPGRPEKSRAEELVGSGIRTLVLQGERDAFGGPDEVRNAVSGNGRTPIEVVAVPCADHSFRVPAKAPTTAVGTLTTLVNGVAAWMSV